MGALPKRLQDKLITIASSLAIGVASTYFVVNKGTKDQPILVVEEKIEVPPHSPAVMLAHAIGAEYESSNKHYGYPYIDKAGKGKPLTVCNGITGKAVIPNKFYSVEECKRLELDIYTTLEDEAEVIFKYWDTYNIYVQASLLDMMYNLGVVKVKNSTMFKKANKGDLDGACKEMPKWVNGVVNGQPTKLTGLVKRRATTEELCSQWGRDGHFSVAMLENK